MKLLGMVIKTTELMLMIFYTDIIMSFCSYSLMCCFFGF